jgi:Domain of unknown function (DUF4349)
MKRRKRESLSADALHELAVLDAALAGERIDTGHDALAELAVTLRELRRRPTDEFALALDARAAQGFTRRPVRGRAARRWTRFGGTGTTLARARSLLARPAAGIALALLIAVAVAVPLISGTTHHSRASARSAKAAPTGQRISSQAEPAASEAHRARGDLAQSSGATAAKGATTPGAMGATTTRLVERTATLDVGVARRAIESSAQRVFTLVSALGGYVRHSSVSAGEARDGDEGGASFDVRVPSANLSGAISALAHLGHVRSENNTTNDVTEQHTSLRSSLTEAQAERSRVLAQLRRATGESEVSALRTRLRALEARIAQLERALRALDQRVTYTSFALSLTPESAAGAATGDLTPGGAAHDAAKILDAALAVLVIAAAALLPLGGLAIAAWVAVALTRRRLRDHALDAS